MNNLLKNRLTDFKLVISIIIILVTVFTSGILAMRHIEDSIVEKIELKLAPIMVTKAEFETFKEEFKIEMKEIAKDVGNEAAKAVIYDYEKKDRTVDADDFVKGWIENKENMTMDGYIQHTFQNKTRVFKGGLLLIENEFETRDSMTKKYGKVVVDDLVDALLHFKR